MKKEIKGLSVLIGGIFAGFCVIGFMPTILADI